MAARTLRITAVLLGRPKSERSAQIKLTLPVAVMSAFINNTPIVAMFLPTLDGVARRVRTPTYRCGCHPILGRSRRR